MKRIVIKSPPIIVKNNASMPFPWSNNLWPGKIDNAVESSGTPRKIEGMKSKIVCVTAIETINANTA